MAATLGANAAMQLGLSDNAISFYQTVLKFDPEQGRARAQYRGLKKVVKLLNKAEEQIQKGYNNKVRCCCWLPWRRGGIRESDWWKRHANEKSK